MDQIITLVLECIIIYAVVRLVLTIFAVSQEVKRVRAELKAQEQAQATKDIEIVIEVHGDVAYFFDKNTNEFIAQGSNAIEFVDHIKFRKFTDVKFLIDNKELVKVAWLEDVFRAHKVEA